MPEYLFDSLHDMEYLKEPEAAIITDVDGTISEIAPTPESASVDDEMRKVLVELSRRHRVLAFISGRSVADALRMVGVPDAIYVGNHGLEYIMDGEYHSFGEAERYTPIIKRCLMELRDEIPEKGVIFEDKGICSAVHYRQCRDPEAAREMILETLKNIPESRRIRVDVGRMIVELKPPIEYNKGVIVREIIERYGVSSAVYLGDDVTDANAFRELRRMEASGEVRAATIIVLSKEIPDDIKSTAEFFVCSVDEVLKFF